MPSLYRWIYFISVGLVLIIGVELIRESEEGKENEDEKKREYW